MGRKPTKKNKRKSRRPRTPTPKTTRPKSFRRHAVRLSYGKYLLAPTYKNDVKNCTGNTAKWGVKNVLDTLRKQKLKSKMERNSPRKSYRRNASYYCALSDKFDGISCY